MDGFAGSLDDSISAASTSDVQDRLSALELRVQQQEDEITLLKAALADVLRRLAISEDHVASVKKSVPSKGQPGLREAISMSCITNGSGANRKPGHSSSVSIARKETLSSAAKSGTEKKKEKPQGQREKKRNLILMIKVHKFEHHLLPSPLHSLSKYTDKLQKARILLPPKV